GSAVARMRQIAASGLFRMSAGPISRSFAKVRPTIGAANEEPSSACALQRLGSLAASSRAAVAPHGETTGTAAPGAAILTVDAPRTKAEGSSSAGGSSPEFIRDGATTTTRGCRPRQDGHALSLQLTPRVLTSLPLGPLVCVSLNGP